MAFEHAAGLGYTYLETDVRATRDGVLLAFHDEVLDRVTTNVAASSNSRTPTCAPPSSGAASPSLGWPTCSSTSPSPGSTSTSSRTRQSARSSSSWSAREPTTACASAPSRRDGCAPSGAGVSRPVATSFGPVGVGLSRFAPRHLAQRVLAGHGDALQVPARHRGVRVVTPVFVEQAHRAGRPLHVWVVDDPAEMSALLDLGVDGLITDRTDVLRDVLTDRGQWLGSTP